MVTAHLSNLMQRGLQWRYIALTLYAACFVLSPFSAAIAGEDTDAGYRQFSATQRNEPFPVDCVAKHAKYFELASLDGSNPDTFSHKQALSRRGYSSKLVEYQTPDVDLVTDRGERVNLAAMLDSERPVMLNFIFTTCTTICPVLSASFRQVQEQLGDGAQDVLMISVSIDPEYDTPEKLAAYAQRFAAGEQWQFLTGQRADIISVEKAFDIYRGSKTNHEPVTFLRRAGKAGEWLRIEGFAKASEIVAEYVKLTRQDS